MNQYDPNVIIQEANEKFAQSELENAQMAYQSALLDWVDDAREMENSGKDITALRDSIATLWIEYAKLNRKANMVRLRSEYNASTHTEEWCASNSFVFMKILFKPLCSFINPSFPICCLNLI